MKKIVLLLATVALLLPSVAFANGIENIDIGFVQGTLGSTGTAITTTVSSNWNFISFSDGTTTTSLSGNFGTLSLTTGTFSGDLALGGTFAPGGSVDVQGGGGTYFLGSFSGLGTWTVLVQPCGQQTCYNYTLSGPVSGVLLPGSANENLIGALTTLTFTTTTPFSWETSADIASGNLALTNDTPEPGTLAMLGIGLIGLGLVAGRRQLRQE